MRLDDNVSRGSLGLEVRAALHVTEAVRSAASTDLSLDRTEDMEVESGGDLPVDEGAGFGGGDNSEREAAKERGGLGQGFSFEGREVGRRQACRAARTLAQRMRCWGSEGWKR
jgi:hypothetical protein